MTGRITGKQFDESPGVEDWRALWGGGFACTYFQTASFGMGAALVHAISELPAAANHHVDVDLRSEGVTVRLFTENPGGLSNHDVELGRPGHLGIGRQRKLAGIIDGFTEHVETTGR